MATAILAVLYPGRFTVYDVRARQQLGITEALAGRKVQAQGQVRSPAREPAEGSLWRSY